MAHKRQLKTLPVPRRKTSKILVFHDDQAAQNQQNATDFGSTSNSNSANASPSCHIQSNSIKSSKRKRDDIEENLSDTSSDFYGFAAESFIFLGEEGPHSNANVSEDNLESVRRSKRKTKKRKHDDYVYY